MKTRAFLAAAIAPAMACSVWAALSDPYKSSEGPGAGDATVFGPDGGAGPDAIADAGRRLRTIDAGFVVYALAAYGDTVFAVDDQAQVHVAREAGTDFTTFYAGDAGDLFFIQSNTIAASAAGVFWTVNSGVRYCALDGGGCGLIASPAAPRAIAASDSVVAWIDNAGVRVCAIPLAGCTPVPLLASKSAERVAVGTTSVAWTDGGTRIHFASAAGPTAVDLPSGAAASLLATDPSADQLYWVSASAVGFVPFDGGSGGLAALTTIPKPTALFAAGGVVYWSLRTTGSISFCRFDDAGDCQPMERSSGLPAMFTTSRAIVATSREVLAVFSSDLDNTLEPVLVGWGKGL